MLNCTRFGRGAGAPAGVVRMRAFFASSVCYVAVLNSPVSQGYVDTQLLLICFLTFVIHLIGTLAYSVRFAGVRTRRIAVSLALFGILMLVSRTSNSFLGPFLAKRVENNLDHLAQHALLCDFRWLLISASLAPSPARS